MIKHLACVMDGSRRWAKKNGLPVFEGMRYGARVIEPIAQLCVDSGIKYLSLYTFSIENFKRSETEKSLLFSFMAQELGAIVDDFVKKDVRVRFLGDRSLFPASVALICQHVEAATQNCSTLNLSLLFCYGGQQEVAHATQHIAQAVQEGKIAVSDITPALISRYLWTRDLPEPEIVIRSGNQQRLSNFMLFQSAYSELFFLENLWPDVTPEIITKVLDEFKQRRRNFGA